MPLSFWPDERGKIWYNTHIIEETTQGETGMNYAEAEKLLKSCGQAHVLEYWKKLSKNEREELLAQWKYVAFRHPKGLDYQNRFLYYMHRAASL